MYNSWNRSARRLLLLFIHIFQTLKVTSKLIIYLNTIRASPLGYALLFISYKYKDHHYNVMVSCIDVGTDVNVTAVVNQTIFFLFNLCFPRTERLIFIINNFFLFFCFRWVNVLRLNIMYSPASCCVCAVNFCLIRIVSTVCI